MTKATTLVERAALFLAQNNISIVSTTISAELVQKFADYAQCSTKAAQIALVQWLRTADESSSNKSDSRLNELKSIAASFGYIRVGQNEGNTDDLIAAILDDEVTLVLIDPTERNKICDWLEHVIVPQLRTANGSAALLVEAMESLARQLRTK